MKRFILDPSFLELFPESRIGVLVCKGIDNHVTQEDKYAPWLRDCEKLSAAYTANPEFTENETVRVWRDAFYRFNEQLHFGLEYARLQTKYYYEGDADDDRFQFTAYYDF